MGSDLVASKTKSKEKIMSVLEHLEEIRKRLIICAVFVAVCSSVAYYYVDQIRFFITSPVGEQLVLVFVSLPEAFLTDVKIAIITGLFASLPIIFQQLWSFVVPGLSKRERIGLFFLVTGSIVFFTLGAAFAFCVILPFSVRFFLEFSATDLQPMITFSGYVSFATRILLAFGVIFQLPLVVFILAKLGIISDQFLSRNRKNAIVPVFLIAAFLTPPDVISQVLLAVPLLALYEFSILMAKLAGKKKVSSDLAADSNQS